ncbi:hypothetical protein G4V62_11770 [Bacillaceae bacterium SIJ1]|uniref:C39 family peptidase n=1 Tax=Litoribacterium kuwaitense TaxID=1398745 RepID=UPI0013EABF27|nr:C39 family peptidase [Litoribacterium kuwaitense]NGP45598.1 hypothetical protein [Litoribacterium kuwaitense]
MRIMISGAMFILLLIAAFFTSVSINKPSSSTVLMIGSSWIGQQKELFQPENIAGTPIRLEGVTYVPSRLLAQIYDVSLHWDSQTAELKLNNLTLSKNKEKQLHYRLIDGISYVPLRAVLTSFGEPIYVYGNLLSLSDPLLEKEFTSYQKSFIDKKPYRVQLANQQVQYFESLKMALAEANQAQATVVDAEGTAVFDTTKDTYAVLQNDTLLYSFTDFTEAYSLATHYAGAVILHKTGNPIFVSGDQTAPSAQIDDVPLIHQYPELPRGCEVTSLAMMLQWGGSDVDKLSLAQEVRTIPATTVDEEGKTIHGHPNDGFVGDMYSLTKPGLGVYHKPVAELANQYAPGRVADLTGSDWEVVEYQLSMGRPVWVIISTTFAPLPSSEWLTWNTSSGPIQITYREHAAIITGYDHDKVYFNEPFGKTSEANKEGFKKGWEQFGKQAITIL